MQRHGAQPAQVLVEVVRSVDRDVVRRSGPLAEAVRALILHTIATEPRATSARADGCYTAPLPDNRISVRRGSHPTRAPVRHVRPLGVTVPYWVEFKNTILPWLLAGGVVTFLVHEHRRTTEALMGANARLAEAVEQQGKALEGVRQLLAAQGYTLPPLNAQQ